MKKYNFTLSSEQDFSSLDIMIDETVNGINETIQRYQQIYAEKGVHMPLRRVISSMYKEGYFSHLTKDNRDDLFFRAYEYMTGKRDSALAENFVRFWSTAEITDNSIKIVKCSQKFMFDKTCEIEGRVKFITISRNGKGSYSLLVETVDKPNAVGFDWGIRTYLTGSDGSAYDSSHFYSDNSERLQELQRIKYSYEEGSAEFKEMDKIVDSIFNDIFALRDDWQYWFAQLLVWKYDYIFIEDLNLEFFWNAYPYWKSKKYDYNHGKFINQILKCACSKVGTVLHRIPIRYASSKSCSCGYVYKELKLGEHHWTCPNCGKENDRDFNAAQNICNYGIRELGLEVCDQ